MTAVFFVGLLIVLSILFAPVAVTVFLAAIIGAYLYLTRPNSTISKFFRIVGTAAKFLVVLYILLYPIGGREFAQDRDEGADWISSLPNTPIEKLLESVDIVRDGWSLVYDCPLPEYVPLYENRGENGRAQITLSNTNHRLDAARFRGWGYVSIEDAEGWTPCIR